MKTSSLISQHVISKRWALLLASLILFAFSLTGFEKFTFDSSPRAYFNDDYPHLLAFDEVEDKYGKDSRIFIMLSSDESDIFNQHTLAALQEITELSWLVPYSLRVDSLANHQHSVSHGDDLIVAPLFEDVSALTEEDFTHIRQTALHSPDILKRLVSDDGKYASISITLIATAEGQQARETESAEAVYALAEDIKQKYPGSKIWITGNVISNYHNISIATSDIATMVPAMFALMFIMIGLLMRSVSGVIACLIVAILATTGALGYASMIGTVFSTLAMNAVIISITVSIAHCIHIISYFSHSYHDQETKVSALQQSLRVNFVPVSITSLTTALGFLSLNFSELPPAAHLGNASAIAVFLAWLFSYTVLPTLLLQLPIKKRIHADSRTDKVMLKLANVVITNRRKLLIVTSTFAIIMVVLATQNIINDRFSEIIKKPHQFRTDNEKIDQHLGGLYNVSYDLMSGKEDGVTDISFMQEVDEFTQWLRLQPEVKSVHTYTDTLKRLNQNMHGDDPAYYRLPSTPELAAQLLLLFEMSVPQGMDLNNLIAQDKSAARLLITGASMDTDNIFAFQERVAAWQQQHMPEHMRHRGASLAIMWSHLSYDSLISSIQGAFIALVIISLILMLVLKSVRYGLISIVPNIIPAAVGFGIWSLISGELGIGLTSVVIITIGIIVDDTVHFMSKYQYARQHDNLNSEDSVRYAFKHVGTPLWVTTVALASGFAILTLSKVHGNSDLGLLTSLILIAALVLDFLLLPALLMFLDRNASKAKAKAVH